MKYLLVLSVLVVSGCLTTEPRCYSESFEKNSVNLDYVEGYVESYVCIKSKPQAQEELDLNHF
jgi:hypothetical protein